MPYIGNTIRAADDYRLIDDISSGFNGSATSFALQVAGSAPVPFPKSPQQILVSVNGVIQEPDPTGASGFNLVGTNIVFSSAPTNGHAFFGIIYATADYLNAGGNFPSGSTGAPSLTFIGDEDTGIYRKGSGSVGFVSNSTEIANTDSNGITISSGDLILGDNRKAKFGASADLQIFHNGSNSFIDSSTGNLYLRGDGGQILFRPNNSEDALILKPDGAVEAYFDNVKKFETSTTGIDITGKIKATSNIEINADGQEFRVGASDDFKISHSSSENINILRSDSPTVFRNEANNETLAKLTPNGAVELYHNNSKKFETTSTGVTVSGDASTGTIIQGAFSLRDTSSSSDRIKWIPNSPYVLRWADNFKASFGFGDDLQIYHDGTNSIIEDTGTGDLILKTNGAKIAFTTGGGTEIAEFVNNGACNLRHQATSRLTTTSGGVDITGTMMADGIQIQDTHKINVGNSQDLQIFHDGTNSLIQNNTGSVIIENSASNANSIFIKAKSGEHSIIANHNGAVELYYDNTKRFETTTTGVKTLGDVSFRTSANTQTILYDESDGRLEFIDNIKAAFGTGADLEIYHNGTSNIILANSGDLNIRTNNSENSIVARQNGAAELYYDNVKKFETNANGVSVVGTTGSNPTIGINHSDADVTGEVVRFKRTDLPTIRYHSIMAQHGGAAAGNFIDFKIHNGSTTTSQSSILKLFGSGLVHVDDNIRLDIGTGSDLHIYHDSTSSVIKNTTGDLYVQSIEDVKLRTNDSELAVDCVVNDAVKLYYDANLKLETTSTGSKTTGMHLIRGESDIDNQGNPLLFLQSNANTNVKAVFLLEDDYTSGRAMLAINVGESGVTNDRDLVLQKAGGRVGLRGTPTVPVHIHGTTQIEATTTIQGGFIVRKASHASFPYLNIDGNSGSTDFYRQTTAGGIVHFFSDVGGTRTMKSYINENGSLVSASDYRLKTDISEITNGISLVKNLKPSTYKFTHDSSTTHHGFIAHELQEVLPNCVDGDKDAVKEDGTTPDYQFYSDQELVPVLTAALKEAITKIETLETKVAALEAA